MNDGSLAAFWELQKLLVKSKLNCILLSVFFFTSTVWLDKMSDEARSSTLYSPRVVRVSGNSDGTSWYEFDYSRTSCGIRSVVIRTTVPRGHPSIAHNFIVLLYVHIAIIASRFSVHTEKVQSRDWSVKNTWKRLENVGVKKHKKI